MLKQKDPRTELVNEYMTSLKDLGILQVSCQDTKFSNLKLTIDSKEVTHFGSCSYLNLECDQRLIDSAIEAVKKYGVQFSCSRAYMSLPLYEEFEHLLSEIFEYPAIVSATTTLAHIANIPYLIDAHDVVIIDHQVHNSVQNAVGIAKSKGVKVELMRHNNMARLESRIKDLQDKYENIWYMADGVYSMFGDFTPAKELEYLLNKYESFNIYVDDAHGMSWSGKNGKGYVLNEIDLHEKMVVTTSLSKGFGSGGGATVLKNGKLLNKIRNCGSTHIFSGPIQPAVLGASIASAKIHLSQEIYDLQDDLNSKIMYFRLLAEEMEIPLISDPLSPIQYVLIGKDKLAVKACHELLNMGFYTCVAGYPSAPKNSSGVRITLNRNHTKDQIRDLLLAISSTIQKHIALSPMS